jgi:molybdopterin/thiamine biosynthesis adenylyltransferase
MLGVERSVDKELSEEEFEYYSRQLALVDIGYTGQMRLRNSKVCILGCGGIGVPGMLMLTAMGVGHVRIVDRDIVSKSDLHRQYLYDSESVGSAKVEVAAEKLTKLNPNVTIEPFAEPIIKRNVSELVEDMDVAVDALDSMETRYLVNRACYERKVPYIFAGAIELNANASTIIPGKTPCLECFFPGFEDRSLPKCSLVGVHPAVIGIISSVQVAEAVSILTGKTPNLAGKLLLVSLADLSFDKVDVVRQESCPVCGSRSTGLPKSIPERYFEEECARDGRRTFVLTPREKVEINLSIVSDRLKKEGAAVKSEGLLGVTFDYSDAFTLSLLKSGTMIAQVSPAKVKTDLGTEITSIYKLFMVNWLGLSPKIIPDSSME